MLVVDGVVTDVTNIVDNLMPSIVAINASGTDTVIDFWEEGLQGLLRVVVQEL